MKIAVVALGKIGLPLAVQYADRGHHVLGADIDEMVVAEVNCGRVPFPGEAELDGKLQAVIQRGLLSATTDTAAAVAEAEAVVVVVPLLVDSSGGPDFRWLDAATEDIARGLRPGTLISYETTVPVGTTRRRFKPALEQSSRLIEGTDFHLVFSPERVLSGRIFADLRRYPKLIGGLSDIGGKHASTFYEAVLEFDERKDLSQANGVWDLGSAEAAELAKLVETTYRDVNIGLANQFAMYAAAEDIDIYEVIDACNSQPYSHIHQPGIAVGGHCIPVYPQLYLWNDPDATIVRAAREANVRMPAHAVDLVRATYGDLGGARAVVLGAAYRGGVKETAFSGVFSTVEALEDHGASVTVHDPLYGDEELERLGLIPHRLGQVVDVAILQADHAEYRELRPADLPGVSVIMDGRRLLEPKHFPSVTMIQLGRGWQMPLPEEPDR